MSTSHLLGCHANSVGSLTCLRLTPPAADCAACCSFFKQSAHVARTPVELASAKKNVAMTHARLCAVGGHSSVSEHAIEALRAFTEAYTHGCHVHGPEAPWVARLAMAAHEAMQDAKRVCWKSCDSRMHSRDPASTNHLQPPQTLIVAFAFKRLSAFISHLVFTPSFALYTIRLSSRGNVPRITARNLSTWLSPGILPRLNARHGSKLHALCSASMRLVCRLLCVRARPHGKRSASCTWASLPMRLPC